MNATQKYQCPACAEVYGFKHNAEKCCEPEKVWLCSECRFVHNDKQSADECCAEETL